jgi:peptide/nickel transport system substrate-binding protein
MMKLALRRRQFILGTAALGTALAMGPRWSFGAEGKILKLRSYGDLQVLDPAYRVSAPEDDITSAIFHRLIRWTTADKWTWKLDAAESIEQVDDTHIRFTLKKGLKWSGGFGELTAEDVKFSYERIGDPKNESPYKDDWGVLDHVEVVDKYSGVIVLKHFFAPLWNSTLPEGAGKILCKAAMKKAGGKFTTTIPAASGPYLLKSWTPKQKTVLARNPDYTGSEKHYFDEIHILPIEDEKTAEIAFEAGDLDYTRVSLSSLAHYRQSPPPHGKMVVKPGLEYVWLGMNVENPALADIRVRQAIQHGVDADAVLQAAYFGQAERATGIIAPGLIGHREKNLTDYNPAKSRELLKAAGKSDGINLTLSVLNKAEWLIASQVIQASLADIGITVEINQHDSGTFWTLGDQKAGKTWKDLQLILNQFSMAPDPSWATVWFTPDQIGVWNWERWNSPEFAELHKKGMAEKDTAKRDAIYKRMQDLMEQSGAYLFLNHGSVAAVFKDSLVPAIRPDGVMLFEDFAGA